MLFEDFKNKFIHNFDNVKKKSKSILEYLSFSKKLAKNCKILDYFL